MIAHNSVEAKEPAPALALHPTFPRRHARGSGHSERWIWGCSPGPPLSRGATKKDARAIGLGISWRSR